MAKADAPTHVFDTIDDWRNWLADNHDSSSGIWLVFWRKDSGRVALDYDETVREALCWGWIDGHTRTLDEQRRGMWFTRRGRSSAWSASNKKRVTELRAAGRMQPAGQAVIDDAKARGLWNLLDDAEAGVEHPELTAALDATPQAREHWDAFPPSARKLALTQIAMARKPETKSARIATIVERASRNERPS
ncbi:MULTISPECIES: YdeI/OmpD-associated family protein [Gordonia]|uniref:YdeI/OmpD-associated family protein n=1 Tax=Gordonia TaxID=2053 RepID=UPI0007EBB830|nr:MULTISPECIES: YdeI/OmpD-associated family protein [Gordonia]OBC10761.1 hypothetical protein A5785_21580 [Gordonia sp. 852002-50395_SCH5434458]OBC15447.1 hypothetical protein A5786_21060 [Gordonia sp. 852002-50816_SCH5313054-a]OBC17749.1 hypothetical protein A5788_11680 [Gordonia sp. 852002-50816_SCH5313054-c]